MTSAPEAPASSSAPLDQLAAELAGGLHRPGSDDYLRLATPWNLAEQTRPLAVVEAMTPDDILATVRFGAAHDVQVGVRATGHGIIDHLGNTILIHTGRLDEVTIHAADGWARIGAGVRWERVINEAAEYGLAPLAGSSPHVGAVGYLTGGGLGPVARTYGVASDRVRALEVVTGGGELLRATATEHPDLFWALRGGKGALGIVTAVETELVHLRTLYGGAAYFDGPDIEKVLRVWAEWCPSLLEQATTSIAILRLPPDAPGVPPQLAGRPVLGVRFAWVGEPEDGERLFAPIMMAATPILPAVGPMPYAQLGMIHSDPVDPIPVHEHAGLLREFTGETIDALLAVAGPDAPECRQLLVEVRQLGGAIARAPEHASAFVHRDAAYTYFTVGIPAGPDAAAVIANAAEMRDALNPWLTGGALPNWAPSADPAEVARTYDDETLERLAALIEQHDPKHVLVTGRPIREAAALQ